ncbi:NAD(+) diphosphatase [Glaciecola sp. MH2013]|uniref:NAD(+) diphosphatase n=1 Tax=Glaciecola sp. MH2013 TaxID=2785524 RepID=UPI00189E7D67|nr:NAD(+) diphosphatase [Glaciecola sp. MH2013]MBF7074125.1 NAD(+) diphosphatase [Glaciecola sp. MH2013]
MIEKKRYFVFSNDRLLVPVDADLKLGVKVLESLSIDVFSSYAEQATSVKIEGSIEHHLVDTQKEELSHESVRSVSLREAVMTMPRQDFQHLAQAWQYTVFLRTHQFCGRCGSRMDRVSWEMAMHCHTCQHRSYPRISPCIIVAIRKQNQIILAQGPRQKEAGFFSILAGFVESGETLEEAVHREVFEEVGISIKNIEYFNSQPWPFPHSLMVGFIAEYESGDIVVDGKEILEAHWFDIDKLPIVPPKFSIAGRLIEETQKRMLRDKVQ